MAEFLFEILSEEIPARMQVRAGTDLSKALTAGLEKAGLTVADAQILTGPRRLTYVAELPLRSPDVSEERKGPRVGSPERALAGFMKAAGLSDISEAEIRTDPKKGEFYVAVMESAGRNTDAIIQELIPEVMSNFPWPKSMKSAGSSFRWVRPLRGMVVLFGGAVVDVTVGGIESGNTTFGHRRHGAGPFVISSFKDYKDTLEGKGHVRLSHEDRKAIIKEKASEICAAAGLELVEDEGLLNEVAGLTEWPVVLLGDMDKGFLELPDEVIRLTLKSHQKTFTVRDPKTGNLASHFIIVANQIAPDGGEAIKAGNGKVISARLSDAVFFQIEDAKKNLIDYYDKLDTVVFHKKLGTIRDKAERVAVLAKRLAPKVGADADKAEQAAKLAKCDLVTQTVIEATSLQGQIGRLMFEREGGDAAIATAIEEHYKPQGPSDSVPTEPVAIAVALADKLDTLVGFWAIDEKPTGSKDPFALRRAALGVVRIILENWARLDLWSIFYEACLSGIKSNIRGFGFVTEGFEDLSRGYEGQKGEDLLEELRSAFIAVLYEPILKSPNFKENIRLLKCNPEKDENCEDGYPDDEYFEAAKQANEIAYYVESWADDKTGISYERGKIVAETVSKSFANNLLAFILDRLKVYLRDKGIRHDIIDAGLTEGQDDLVAIVNRVTALQSFLETDDGENLLAGYKRAANILKAEAKKGDLPTGEANRPKDEHGAALFDAMKTAQPAITSALETEDYAKALIELANLRAPIDAFFTYSQIIADDTAVRENNLRLLAMISDTSRQIADFEAIQG